MRVRIISTQEEFDEKRIDLLKAIAGKKAKVTENALLSKPSPIKAQNEMLEYWDKQWQSTVAQIKKEIGEMVDETS